MTGAVTMPALSDTMGAGRLVKWTKKTGDKIKKGERSPKSKPTRRSWTSRRSRTAI